MQELFVMQRLYSDPPFSSYYGFKLLKVGRQKKFSGGTPKKGGGLNPLHQKNYKELRSREGGGGTRPGVKSKLVCCFHE